jgi:hypothetical protein
VWTRTWYTKAGWTRRVADVFTGEELSFKIRDENHVDAGDQPTSPTPLGEDDVAAPTDLISSAVSNISPKMTRFQDWETQLVPTANGRIYFRYAGKGQPILLLHGVPQHSVRQYIARGFTQCATLTS